MVPFTEMKIRFLKTAKKESVLNHDFRFGREV